MNGITCCKMDIRTLPDETLEALLDSLPPRRGEKARRMRQLADRKRSAAAGLLLRYVLSGQGLPESDVDYLESGRPWVRGREDLFVTLSHSGDYAVCALGGSPIAVDIQEHSGSTEAIVRRCYTERERAFCAAGGDGDESRRRFYEIWVRKECLAKLNNYRYVREIDTYAPSAGYAYYVIPMAGYSCAFYGPEPPGELRELVWSPEEGFRVTGTAKFHRAELSGEGL